MCPAAPFQRGVSAYNSAFEQALLKRLRQYGSLIWRTLLAQVRSLGKQKSNKNHNEGWSPFPGILAGLEDISAHTDVLDHAHGKAEGNE